MMPLSGLRWTGIYEKMDRLQLAYHVTKNQILDGIQGEEVASCLQSREQRHFSLQKPRVCSRLFFY